MEGTETEFLIFLSNLIGGVTLLFYAFFLYMKARAIIDPSPKISKLITGICICGLLTPLAARFYFSEQTILALSITLLGVGCIIKLRQKMGV